METFRADTSYKDVEHYGDKLLIVCAEGTVGFGDRSKPVGLLDEAVVVAATDGEARELWSQFGQDTEGMFDGLMPPPTGGAWVFEGCISWDDNNEDNIIRGRWRRPSEEEAKWLCGGSEMALSPRWGIDPESSEPGEGFEETDNQVVKDYERKTHE